MDKYGSKRDLTPVVPRRFRTVFFMLVSCFALWGLLNNMTDNLVPAFEKIFGIKPSDSAGVQIAFYGAYAVLAIFAAMLAEEFSYRIGVLIGLCFYMLGALIYIPACLTQSFDTYLLGIFILAGGLSILETTCNPYVLALGPAKTAVRRLNFAQAFNPIGSLLGIFMAKYAILGQLDATTPAERKVLAQTDPDKLNSIINGELFWVCVPYVGLIIVAGCIWMYFMRHRNDETYKGKDEPEVDAPKLVSGLGKPALILTYLGCVAVPIAVLVALNFACPDVALFGDKVFQLLCVLLGPIAYILIIKNYRHIFLKLVKIPRYYCGVIAQFFYVGVQIAAWTWLNKYCQKEMGISEGDAAVYYLYTLILFIVCRWVATYYMKKYNPASMMSVFAIAAIATCAGVMYLPSYVTVGDWWFAPNVFCLVLMSGCMSLMFPTIYGIALGGLEKDTVKLGAAGLIMAILGGAIITPWMGAVIENGSMNWLTCMYDQVVNENLSASSASLRASFIVPAICFAVVLAYSLLFRKPATTKD